MGCPGGGRNEIWKRAANALQQRFFVLVSHHQIDTREGSRLRGWDGRVTIQSEPCAFQGSAVGPAAHALSEVLGRPSDPVVGVDDVQIGLRELANEGEARRAAKAPREVLEPRPD